MKEIKIRTLDDTELDLVAKMKKIGFSRKVAAMFMFLAKSKDQEFYSSRDIERAAYLRQPEVSIARKYLAKYISVSKGRSEKGRPRNQFQLTADPNEILDNISMELYKEYLEKIDIINSIVNNINMKYAEDSMERNKELYDELSRL